MKSALRRYRPVGLLFGVVTASFLVAVPHAGGQSDGKGENRNFSLGVVSEINRASIEEHFRDLARYIAARLGSAVESRVVVAPTPFQMAKLLEQRKVDLYLESPYPTYVINYVHGAGKLLLRRWKGGAAEYHSLIFAKREGAVRKLDDLRGKTIGFEDPSSTSGYLLPRFFLARAGFKLVEKKPYDPNATQHEVRYVFAQSQEKLLNWVLTSQVDAGAFSNDDHNALDSKRKAEIAVLAQTERLPRHLVSVRKDLAAERAGRIEKILLAMHEEDEGRRILARTDGTTKFDLLPGGDEAMRRRLLETFVAVRP